MNLETVNYQHDGGVAIIKLNRPQAGNALSAQLASDLLAAASGTAKNDNVRAVVFSAEGDFFCNKCGIKQPESDSRFCSKCGNPLQPPIES